MAEIILSSPPATQHYLSFLFLSSRENHRGKTKNMASFHVNALLAAVLILLSIAANAVDDSKPPFPAPPLGNICNSSVNCGRGTCEAAPGSPFNFKCRCEPGWRQTLSDDDPDDNNNNTNDDKDDDFEFLPCVIPNCSMNYSCMPAAPPAPAIPKNFSIFDPCYWTYCGEGTCVKNTTHSWMHMCQCNPGADNLLNITAFPCYRPCALGSNCQDLGINTSSSTPSSSSNENPAALFLPGKFHWIAILMVSATMALWKQ